MSIDQAGSRTGRFFDPHQHETIEAAMARIIPTDDQPGAREAGTIEFLERYLSGIDYIYAKPDGSGFETLDGKRAEAWQQRIDRVRATYVAGIAELDRHSHTLFGKDFARLTDGQQDRVLSGMERPEHGTEARLDRSQASAAWAPVEPALQQISAEVELSFFPLLCLHTRQGFYADPIYGGNNNYAGWRLIGFAGPDSLAETHAGRYTTLPYFAEEQIAWGEEDGHDV